MGIIPAHGRGRSVRARLGWGGGGCRPAQPCCGCATGEIAMLLRPRRRQQGDKTATRQPILREAGLLRAQRAGRAAAARGVLSGPPTWWPGEALHGGGRQDHSRGEGRAHRGEAGRPSIHGAGLRARSVLVRSYGRLSDRSEAPGGPNRRIRGKSAASARERLAWSAACVLVEILSRRWQYLRRPRVRLPSTPRETSSTRRPSR
jgi:hypothetical protein